MTTKKALILTGQGFEDAELLCPMYRLLEAGCSLDIAAATKGPLTGIHGYTVQADLALDQLSDDPSADYDLLFIPGGKPPAELRKNEKALKIARGFDKAEKTIASICHGPQVLMSAGLLEGRRVTSYSGVAGEFKDYGAHYENIEVVVEDNYIFSRTPKDIPAFNHELMRQL
ncbi:MAG: type 1 glutamine amidotransferase domain-containing protein [Thermodesulfobacteriota bacterium]